MDAETRKYLDGPWELRTDTTGQHGAIYGPDGDLLLRLDDNNAAHLMLAKDVGEYILELKRDRERLNWLEARGLSTNGMDPNRERHKVHSWRYGDSGPWTWTATRISSEFKSLRDAIDAAEKGQTCASK